MTHKSEINSSRRQFLNGSAIAAGLAIAPGVMLHQVAQAKPADQAVTSDKRWGMLIDTNKCSKGCDACVRGCQTENGWGENETKSGPNQVAQ
ncbi:MAG: twin-arginine translocation signal domain-containing protein, partial [Gammaproteobacteria bacterium]|nr:twin-arginine translocation signal domain-containing protein [Gammaproteobacteria bacterium]